MSLDLNFPYTGSTPWATLYAGLRENFSQLNAKFSPGSWTTLTFGSGLNSGWLGRVSYAKNSFGLVYLTGECQTYNSSASSTAFTLNSGYRPAASKIYPGRNYYTTDTYQQKITITSGGACNPDDYAIYHYVFVEGIAFWAGY